MYLVIITIPYTFPLRSYRRFGKSVFHFIFKDTFEKKKTRKWSSLNFAFAKAKLYFDRLNTSQNAEHYSTIAFHVFASATKQSHEFKK